MQLMKSPLSFLMLVCLIGFGSLYLLCSLICIQIKRSSDFGAFAYTLCESYADRIEAGDEFETYQVGDLTIHFLPPNWVEP